MKQSITLRKITKEDLDNMLEDNDMIDLFGAPQTPWECIKWGFEVKRPIDGFISAIDTFLWWPPKTRFGKWFHRTFPSISDNAAERGGNRM